MAGERHGRGMGTAWARYAMCESAFEVYWLPHVIQGLGYNSSFHVLPHTVYLCVLYGSENKQRLFPYTALTDWFL